MSIRWKLLVLLLAIALVPLAVVTFVGQRSARRLGTDFADQTGRILAQSAEHHLLTIVDHAARTIYRQRQLVELALSRQALEVEARLAHRPREGVRVLFDTDFDEARSLPVPLQPSPRHVAPGPDGRRRPLMLCYVTQVVRLAPGVEREQVADDIARVADLTDAYRPLQQTYDDLIYWQFTALESGVHTSYPGKGSYPADFDARTRPWYVRAREAGETIWVPPTRDALTGNVMMACAMPVKRPDGRFAGVTAIDVSLGEMMKKIAMPRAWQKHAQVMLVHVDENASPDLPLVLVSQRDDDDADRSWRAEMLARPLRTDDPGQARLIMSDMLAGLENVRELSAGGKTWLCSYGPVSDMGSYFMVMVPQDEIVAEAKRVELQMLSRTWGQLHLTAGIALAVLALTVAAGLLASRHFTHPVQQLADAAAQIAAGDLDARVEIHTGDELSRLGRTFNDMVPKLRDLMTVRQSLSLAMEVQQSLLPAAAPTVEGLDIAGHSIYCDETGGDYYDFLTVEEIGSHVVGIVVGDVTGHGVAAALLMATARALIRGRLDTPQPLADTMTHVNRHLSIDRLPGRFMTLFCCVIDARARLVRWTSAGHDPAIVYHPGDDRFSEWDGEDLPLGIDPCWQYHERSRTGWSPGDVVVVGTDGIWECRNHAGEQFGKDRLRQVIRRHATGSAAKISRAITDAVGSYRGDRPQQDDITLVVVKLL